MLSFYILDTKEGRVEVYPVKYLCSEETIDGIVLGFGATRNLGITLILMTL